MFNENNVAKKISIIEKQITELQEKINKLEALILNNNKYYNNNNYAYSDTYNIKNEVNLDNNVFTRSIDLSEPKLVRQHAFILTRP